MYTKSGEIRITKTEEKNIRILLEHANMDMRNGGYGTYSLLKTDKDGDYLFDEKNSDRAKDAIGMIEHLLATIIVIKR